MSHDTWIHRIARVGVRPLVGTPVTPNHVTTLRLVTGLAATAAFAVGSRDGQVIGGAIFLFSMILDRADGELARLAGKSSAWGHKYDLVVDAFCNAVIFAGIGFGLRHGGLGHWATAMGAVAGLAVAIILWIVLRTEELAGERAAEFRSTAGFDPDDAMLVVPLTAWIGWVQGLIVAAFVGAPLFALFMYARFRRRVRETGS